MPSSRPSKSARNWGDSAKLTVLSIGPDRTVEAIKKALAMGADKAVHVRDPAAAGKDPWQIASIIAAYAKDQAFDLIFTGMQSQDRGSAQVGVAVAEQLGFACTTTVIGFQCETGPSRSSRELEGGVKGVVRLKTPALVTCQLGLNVPRYPTLPNIMKAKRKEIAVITVADLFDASGAGDDHQFPRSGQEGGRHRDGGSRGRTGGQGGGSAQGQNCSIALVPGLSLRETRALFRRAKGDYAGNLFPCKTLTANGPDHNMKALLIGEYREGKLLDSTYELFGFASQLAAETTMLLVGGETQLPAYDGTLFLAEATACGEYNPDAHKRLILEAVRRENPDYIVFLHSSYGWDLCAAGGGRAQGRPGIRVDRHRPRRF